MIEIPKRLVPRVVGRLVPITSFIGTRTIQKCPFHDDNTPSSKLYEDPDGTVRLFCYRCKKQYTSFDYLSQIEQTSPERYLREHVSEEAIVVTVRQLEKESVERPPYDFTAALARWGETGRIDDLVVAVYSE